MFLTKASYWMEPGADSIKRRHLNSIGNPFVEMRRSDDRLFSTIGLPILVRGHLYIEWGPRCIHHTVNAFRRKQSGAILQTPFSMLFSCMQLYANWSILIQFHWNQFPWVKITISQNRVRYWPLSEPIMTMLLWLLSKSPQWYISIELNILSLIMASI